MNVYRCRIHRINLLSIIKLDGFWENIEKFWHLENNDGQYPLTGNKFYYTRYFNDSVSMTFAILPLFFKKTIRFQMIKSARYISKPTNENGYLIFKFKNLDDLSCKLEKAATYHTI